MRDAMQHHVVGVVPEMTVRELIQVLLENAITGAPVIDSRGKLVGVVSTTDVMRLAAHEAEIPAGQLGWAPVPIAEELGERGTEAEPEERTAFAGSEILALSGSAFDQCQVRDIMTPVAFTVGPADGLGTAVRFLLQGRIHRALVVEDGVLQGIITPFDILQALDWE